MRDQPVTTPTMTIAELVRHGQQVLSQVGIPNYSQEVLWILQAALNRSTLTLHLEGDCALSLEEWDRGQEQLSRRANREPLQYILGTQEFYGLEFEVDPSVLIPRPETHVLVESALQQSTSLSKPVVIDIGTGSGCVAIALAHRLPEAIIYATDLSPQALTVAKSNARRHGVEQRIIFLEGNLLEPFQDIQGSRLVPIIVSNPPYIAPCDWEELQPEVRSYEPPMALEGGSQGLDILKRLVREAPVWLEKNGWLNLEVGQGQAEKVIAMAKDSGHYSNSRTASDESGIDRVVSLQKQ